MYPDRIKNAQIFLAKHFGYRGAIDGRAGPQTQKAARRVPDTDGTPYPAWPFTPERIVIAALQVALRDLGLEPGPPDGYYGPQTDFAFNVWLQKAALPDRSAEDRFGSEATIRERFGPAGGPACTAGIVRPPFPMVLAWNEAETVESFRCHIDVQQSMQVALENVADVYLPHEIIALGLHLYGGCYNYRNKRGGKTLSAHASGIALDNDPIRNRLHWGADRARLARPDARRWFEAWEAEGWHSLGREKGYDYMHVQAVAP